MNFLKKIQNLPLPKRKMVFWIILCLVAISAFSFWLIKTRQKLESFGQEEFFENIELPLKEIKE